MKRLSMVIIIIGSLLSAKSQDYIESYNEISDNYVDLVQDVQVIRTINSGTIIIPEFDESCPEEMKTPFEYACKIVEEYLPPCLPLKVKVSCGRVNSSSGNAISKVSAYSKENFGSSSFYNNATMCTIKGVIFGEYIRNSSVTYLNHVPDVQFLTENPDIEIIYNNQKLDDIYFSLDINPGEKYDFISLAIRDLLKGLGFISGFRYNPITGGLENPAREMNPFESFINNKLGTSDNPIERLSHATQGELLLQKFSQDSLKLYAPTTWVNGVSLNYFIPQNNIAVSKILTHDFCKGMVIRSISDNYASEIFSNLLGWKYDYPVSITTPNASASGSSSLLMPYNGSFEIDNYDSSTGGIAYEAIDQNFEICSNVVPRSYSYELEQYIEQFNPFLTDGERNYGSGVSVSILKKDGTWDLVQFIPIYLPDMNITLNMSDWVFHCANEDYARTVDGYLRCRITTKHTEGYNYTIINSTFIVVDYMPQKVGLSYSYTDNNIETLSTNEVKNVRLYFSNIEGVNRIVLERLREGFRVPSKINITDVKRGYYDTTIDRNTTFTAVGYNDNGYTRGVPVTITFISDQNELDSTSLDISIKDNIIAINNIGITDSYNYTIRPLIANDMQKSYSGKIDNRLDVSYLPKGLYLLTIFSANTGVQSTLKFKR